MLYRSTRGSSAEVSLAEAVRRGLAPDGGLYQPTEIPVFDPAFWRGLGERDLGSIAAELLTPYIGADLAPAAAAQLVREALDFPVPLTRLEERTWLLELFHGPTLAFKDVGARFLARLQAALRSPDAPPVTVLVATSGDTGGAVAQAFHQVGGFRVVVLYPLGRVSPRQECQFAALGDNVRAIAVEGSFDDCQRLVKGAFANRELAARFGLTSANSINIGRLLPQITYYAWAWSRLGDPREAPIFCTPSGNFGNLTAGLMARRMGLPCAGFIAAVNVNRVVPDFLATGLFSPRPSLPTIAHAMDVGNPSNLDRIRDLFGDDLDALRAALNSSSHTDDEIRDAIGDVYRRTGTILDPHTAVGYLALARYRRKTGSERPAVLLATAHPSKFPETVEPVIGAEVPLPPQLAACLGRPFERRVIGAEDTGLGPILLAPWPDGW